MSQEQEANDTIQEELDTFVPDTEVFVTTTGREVVLPKITWAKEKIIAKQIGDLFDSIEEIKAISLEQVGNKEIAQIMGTLLKKAPDVITSLASQITDLSEEEVDSHLDSRDLVRLLVPFFSERIQDLSRLVQQILTS